MAVYEFEKSAHEHHKAITDGAPPNESDKDRKKRIAEWEAVREHLRKERTKLKSLAKLHSELEDYRNEAKGKSEDDLLKEPHHPTKVLAKNLAAVDEPRPSPDHVAHHIIPGKGRWLQAAILDVRLTLHEFGIGINDPMNGIYLPDKKEHRNHCTTPKAPVHKELHCWNYENWITANLPETLRKPSFIKRLELIKRQLRDGNHPPEVVQKKDANWNPIA